MVVCRKICCLCVFFSQPSAPFSSEREKNPDTNTLYKYTHTQQSWALTKWTELMACATQRNNRGQPYYLMFFSFLFLHTQVPIHVLKALRSPLKRLQKLYHKWYTWCLSCLLSTAIESSTIYSSECLLQEHCEVSSYCDASWLVF